MNLGGMLVGLLVFFALLFGFPSGTGPGELILWLAVAIVGGVLVAVLLKPAEDRSR